MDEKTKLDKQVFVDGVTKLEEIFGKLDVNLLDLYYELLCEWTERDFKRVVKKITETYDRNYFPKPAVFFKIKTESRYHVR